MDSLLRKKKKGLPIQLFFYLKVKPLTLDPLPGPPRPCLHLEVPAGLSWVWGLLMSPGQRYLILQVPKWMSQEKKKKNQESKKKDNRGSNTQLKATSATFHEADSWSKAKTDPSEFILSPLCQALYMQSSQPVKGENHRTERAILLLGRHCFGKDPQCLPNLLQVINPFSNESLTWMCLLA